MVESSRVLKRNQELIAVFDVSLDVGYFGVEDIAQGAFS
jgi:hypothetical protein